jgi:hypothetical protein
MSTNRWLEHLYVGALALLVVHEIDSAFWHEWELFGLGGGIQGFLISNLALLLPFLYGLAQVARRQRGGAWFGLALGIAGIVAFGIHGWLLLAGRPEFRQPASLLVLGGALVTSVPLFALSVRALRSGPDA